MRAQQIGERRHRYGVDNPKTGHSGSTGAGTGGGSAGFSAAENQDLSLKLVAANDPVGVDMDMKVLEDWVTMQGEANKVTDVLAVVGFGGVGKTTIATDLYNKFRDQFEHRATVTVSQSSDLEAILTNIKSQVMPRSDDHQQGHLPGKKGRLAAIRGLVRKVQQRTSGVIAKCSVGGDSDEMEDSAKLSQLKKDLINILNEKSIFPKGSRISRKRLIRRWIAEGFVSEKQGMSVEDVAETYFTHLVRRKIIRPVEHSRNGKVKNCVTHDMILEHIVAKASEENFITVVGGHWLMQPPSTKVRRLSLQGSDSKRAKDTEKMNLSHVRSLTMFGDMNQLPSRSFKFGIIQVLDLEGCTGFRNHHTNEICKMHLIKYLSLRRTDIKELPKAIKKLDNLETLDIRETQVVELPSTVCNLRRLVNILGGNKMTRKALRVPEELLKKKKMAALRILSGIEIVGGSANLHHLTELRKLAIYRLQIKEDDPAYKELLSSIAYLGGFSLHTLVIDDSSQFLQSLDTLVNPPRFLTALELNGMMVKLPVWMEQLDALNKLTLSITLLQEDSLGHLSKLKALFSLTFTLDAAKQDQETVAIIEKNKSGPNGEVIVPSGGFEKLKLLRFYAPRVPLLSFSRNAMPCLERLELSFSMLEGLLGTENLLALKEVHLSLGMKRKDENPKGHDIAAEQIKKRIENDIDTEDRKGARMSTAMKPKILFDQYYD
nr:unnamed protein product [Digitaria exilis]